MKQLTFHFTKDLNTDESKLLGEFYGSFTNIVPEQRLDWFIINNPGKKYTQFFALGDGKMVSYAIIKENYRIARLFLGPLYHENEIAVESIREIYRHYKNRSFGELIVQLGNESSQETDGLEYKLSKYIRFHQHFDPINWSTLILDLSNGYDAIRDGYRRNHKRSLEKFKTLNLNLRKLEREEEIQRLAALYDSMYSERKLRMDFSDSQDVFTAVFRYFRKYNCGICLGVYNEKQELLGGIMNVFSDTTMYYRYAATNRDATSIPILHTCIDESIKIACEMKLRYFDFWSYNHFVKESDQIARINLFKQGFGGREVFYPKAMKFRCNSIMFLIISSLKWARNHLPS